MNEEEIIKMLKEYSATNPFQKDMFYVSNLHQAIQGLLDLYQLEKVGNENLQILLAEEKEKNKELEECLKAEEKYAEGLNNDIKSLLNIEPNDNYIPKCQIEEKIKELESIEPADDDYNFEMQNDIHSKINILQELLEERN